MFKRLYNIKMSYDPKHAPYNSKKDTARSLVDYHLRKGNIKKKPCARCGAKNAEADHSNYDQPLNVTWLCRDCHAKKRIGKSLKTAIASQKK